MVEAEIAKEVLPQSVEHAKEGSVRTRKATNMVLYAIWIGVVVVIIVVLVGAIAAIISAHKAIGSQVAPVPAESDKKDGTENPVVPINDNNTTSVNQLKDQGGLGWGG